ncbi:hypothetical protein [Rhodococcus sp. X156]|uniref:hypothetical protein n=1 Tax=Rhodococcus sp. X156 TaxID=2499145 RepID=UPI0013E2CB9D|nr:hypothetical protein [Rhodococcus sp. X156]
MAWRPTPRLLRLFAPAVPLVGLLPTDHRDRDAARQRTDLRAVRDREQHWS